MRENFSSSRPAGFAHAVARFQTTWDWGGCVLNFVNAITELRLRWVFLLYNVVITHKYV